MPDININDVIPDGLLQAPLVLAKNFEAPLKQMKEFIALAKQYNDIMGTSTKTVGDHKKKTEELTEQEKVLSQVRKQIAVETAKQSEAYKEQVQILNNLKTQNKELAANQDLTKNFQAQHSSITELNKALQANRIAYSAMRGDNERNSASGKALLKTIQDQKKDLDRLNDSIGKTSGQFSGVTQGLDQILSKMGPIGQQGSNAFKIIGEAAVSGWGVAAGAIGLASFALTQFFERTDVGQILWSQKVDLMSIKWDQFKNKIAGATGELTGLNLTPEQSYEQRKKDLEEQIVKIKSSNTPGTFSNYSAPGANPITEGQKQDAIDKLTKEYQLNEEIYSLAVQKHKIDEDEIPLIVTRITKLDQAKKLELEARDTTNPDISMRLKDALAMESLFKTVHSEDMEFAEKRVGVANQEIYLRAQGRSLLVSERREIEKNIASVVQLQLEFDSAEKRRQKLIQSLLKKDNKDVDYSGYEKDYQDMLNAIKKLNDEDAKETADKDKQDANDQKASDDLMFRIQDKAQDEQHKNLIAKWQREYDFKQMMKEKEIQLAQTTGAAIVGVVNDQYNAQIARQQVYLNQIKENYQEEMEMTSGNKIAQAQLTAKFREDEKRAQKEMLSLKRKEAEFDKVAAELTIAIKTGEAIMKDVAAFPLTGGEPFAAIDAAIGAVQLAAIMAKPLPSYELGTKDHKGGKAIVGEKGFELYTTPSGKMGFTSNHTSIIDLPKGSQVETHDNTLQLLALAGLNNLSLSDRMQKNPNDKVIAELKEVKEAIQKQKSDNTNFYKMMSGYYSFKKESETFARKIMVERFGNI